MTIARRAFARMMFAASACAMLGLKREPEIRWRYTPERHYVRVAVDKFVESRRSERPHALPLDELLAYQMRGVE